VTRAEAWCVHAAGALVGGTGLVYGWMRYFAEPADPFSLVNHPAEPLWHSAHIVFAPLLVFACALVWRDHVWARFRSRSRTRRRTGLVLAATLGPMIASGYLLQVSVEECWRTTWLAVHLATSLVWLPCYVGHHTLAHTHRPLTDSEVPH
jgi:hypothetical protein